MSLENKFQWNVKDVALALLTNPQMQAEMTGEVSDGNLCNIFNTHFQKEGRFCTWNITVIRNTHYSWIKTAFVQGCFFAKGFQIVPIVKHHGFFKCAIVVWVTAVLLFLFFICYLILLEMLLRQEVNSLLLSVFHWVFKKTKCGRKEGNLEVLVAGHRNKQLSCRTVSNGCIMWVHLKSAW